MTTEEKLKHFEDICTGDALKKYEQAVSDYTAYEEKILSDIKKTRKSRQLCRSLPRKSGSPGKQTRTCP